MGRASLRALTMTKRVRLPALSRAVINFPHLTSHAISVGIGSLTVFELAVE